MKTAVSIPDPIFAAADDLARRLGISRSELYARALSLLVAADRQGDVTRVLDRVYAKRASKLDPGLTRAQLGVLRRNAW
jgi:hypothetical protein